MKIFIVEDDEIIARQLKAELVKWQYEVVLVQQFTNVLTEFVTCAPELVLLDINLPAFNGYHWCREIRQQSNVPIIFISSRSENMDQVMAMQMGADDFITKPIDLTLALAKIQAILRRTYDYSTVRSTLRFNDLILDYAKGGILLNEQFIELTHTQLQLLEVLMNAQGEYVDRERLMAHCWEQANYIDENTLSVNISRLRKRLSEYQLSTIIHTKKGHGYALKEQSDV